MCAAATGTATAAGPTPTHDARAANAAADVVVQDPGRFQPRQEELTQAGSTGYAHRREGTPGYLWTDGATGAERSITDDEAAGHSGLHVRAEAGRVTVTDLATEHTALTLALPEGRTFGGAYTADTVLTTGRDAQGRYDAFQLLRVVNGHVVEQPVTGLPGTFGELRVVTQDTRGAVLSTWQPGHLSEAQYLLDYATATLKPVAMFGEGIDVSLGETRIGYYDSTAEKLFSAPRTDPTTVDETPLTTAENADDLGPFTALGKWIVFTRKVPAYKDLRGGALQAVHIGTGLTKELLPHAGGHFATTPDGGLLVTGGTGSSDWAVRRVDLAPDGTPRVTTVREVPRVRSADRGLALAAGRLSFLARNSELHEETGLYDADTTASSTPTPTRRLSLIPYEPGLAGLGDGESVFSAGPRVHAPLTGSELRTAELPGNGRVVDGAGRYVLARSGDTTWAVDLENPDDTTPDVKLTLTDSAAALWDTKVWKPAATAGRVDSYDLNTGVTSAALDLASGCAPTELQAVGRWLYWACGTDKAGVYDRTLRKSVPVPVGDALLGDGFVVQQVDSELRLTNASTGQTTDFADLPYGMSEAGRGIDWTVDKFGGGVAFVGTDGDIHVRQTGVTPQPLARLEQSVEPLVFEGAGVEPLPAVWSPVWRFSKAVGSWQVRVAKGNGETVRTYSGERGAGAAVRVRWDGKDSQGRGIESGQYLWEVTAHPLDGLGPLRGASDAFDVAGSSLTTLPGTYTPVTPTRLMDTRSGLGVPQERVPAGGTVVLQVAGKAGVPTEGLTAVVLNVTATDPTEPSFVSVYPHDTRRTSASNLNFAAGRTAANLVTVPVVNGWVEFYNKNGSVHLLADVAGYYTEGTSGSEYQPVTPKRLMDTRDGTGVPKAKVGPGGTVTLPVTEPGVTAVALNVTATAPTATSFVSAYPYGTARPTVSNLNFTAGRTVPNLVIVPVKDGKVTFYNHTGTVDLIADVTGYYKDGEGSVFTGMQPKRLMDTRDGTGVPKAKVGAGKTVSLEVGDTYTAVVLNVTATDPTAAGFVSVYPYGTQRAASNLNFTAGQTVPNLVIVPVKDGKVTFYNHTGTVDLIADVTGYYTG
ncbi:hypothetical protein OG393_18150 [Streptomyces sp. NBC_01216]|uniref:FlgD immunoglobulin-like domain containing protein n=1 Tax=Streptomyces sp. NBC_01216 TaxID=2903778 RepID=UPI002E11A484|nr:hypothetical protein OG393_18150 [Streptomyces sp. NBC_01216]